MISLSERNEIIRILQTMGCEVKVEDALFKTLLHDLMTARRRLPAEFITQFEKKSGEAP